MAGLLLTHANVVMIAVILFNKVDQVWEQVLLVKVVKPLDQLRLQSR
jgi:hypothetical protein